MGAALQLNAHGAGVHRNAAVRGVDVERPQQTRQEEGQGQDGSSQAIADEVMKSCRHDVLSVVYV